MKERRVLRTNLSIRLTALAVALAVPFTGISAAGAETAPVAAVAQSSPSNVVNDQRAREFTEALNTINSVPGEVLAQGDTATRKWLAAHSQLTSTRADVPRCTAAVALFLGTNLVSVAKIVKIKRLIGELGGVAEAVKIMWGASFSYEKMQTLGGTIAALAGEFFGVTGIREKCFN